MITLHLGCIPNYINEEPDLAPEQLECIQRGPHILTHGRGGRGRRRVQRLRNVVHRDALAVTRRELEVQTQETGTALLQLVQE